MLQRSSRTGSRRTVRLAVETLEDRATPSAMAADGLLTTSSLAGWQPPPTTAPALVLPPVILGEEMAAGHRASTRGYVDGDIILLGIRKGGEDMPAPTRGVVDGDIILLGTRRSGEELPEANRSISRGAVDGDVILLKTRRSGEELPEGNLPGGTTEPHSRPGITPTGGDEIPEIITLGEEIVY